MPNFRCIAVILAFVVVSRAPAADKLANLPFPITVPDGFSIELAAGAPLIERPIVATFDDDGHLYVAESSGSNDPVQKQLEDKPHRVVRLDDTDGDGRFDRRTVFADHLMFPEGALFFDGSLYVSAPPSIWKLTDKDGDGVADERVEWFKGKTLTGCANDLHGPYAGPDGWIYWCKGAFAEQTYKINGRDWTTKAAHIFRCRPDGTGLEPVITAGMDNPVDIAFMPDGERILSGTYYTGNPRHDGLAHAVYGGVFGKEHNVLDGHPRTGELMPVFDAQSPTAPCGLERYDSDVFGPEYRDNLFLAQFNMRRVSRHVLRPNGATFVSEDSDFVSSEFVDFHPTDVVVDADGSLLVIDTGGWYKLCCPTSQLWKPDILGGIYRVKKNGAKVPDDPRGRKIDWPHQTLEQLWDLHADSRPAVRFRASREFVRRAKSPEIENLLRSYLAQQLSESAEGTISKVELSEIARIWTLSQLETPESRQLLHAFFSTESDRIRHAILQVVSLNRDPHILEHALLIHALDDPSPSNRRMLAEAIGRLGEPLDVPNLLNAAAVSDDRVLQHSIIYALIEIANPAETRQSGLGDKPFRTIAAALIALDQMPGGDIKAADVIPHLNSQDDTLHDAARWIVSHHPDWGSELTAWLREQLKALPEFASDKPPTAVDANLEVMLVGFSSDAAVQQLLADFVSSPSTTRQARDMTLRVMAAAKLREPPPSWVEALSALFTNNDEATLPLAIAASRAIPKAAASNQAIVESLTKIANSTDHPDELRVEALNIISGRLADLSDAQFSLLFASLAADKPVALRSTATDAIAVAHLSGPQLVAVCGAIKTAGPLEINRLFKAFEQSQDDALGVKLIESLRDADARSSVRIDLVRASLAKYGPAVQEGINKLESLINVDAAAQRKRIDELLPLVAKGDVRRGHEVFYSSKATCSSCHRLGNAGGTTGPDLSHIGKTRTERDLLESVLFPSLSFVRSYEPMLIVTADGKTINGVIHDETAKEYVVATGPDQEVRVARDEVEQIQPSTVSIMPAGLDKQLSDQQLADLVAFLKGVTSK